MKKLVWIVGVLALTVMAAGPARAHFGMVIPSDQMVMQGEDTNITVDFMFWHPFEGHGMELVKPAKAAVVVNGKQVNLLPALQSTKKQGHQTWRAHYITGLGGPESMPSI